MLEKKKLLIGAAGVAIAAAYSAPVDAKITLAADEPSGWEFSVDGNVNAFYVYSTGYLANHANGQTQRTSRGDNSRIQTGLLPSKFGFGVQGPASNGVQLRGYFGLYPQIQNGATKTGRGAQLDMREIYAAASGDFGEVLFGRTLSLFQRNAIVQDMTLFGVGATANNVGNNGTTLGRIGFGYVYPDFNASFRWTSPSYNGTTLSVGIYDPSKITAGTANGAEANKTADEADLPRFEGELNLNLSQISEGSNLAISGMYQEAQVQGTRIGGPEIEAAEISQAFSTGAVESMITSPTTGKNKKIWENGVKYFYDIAAWFPKNMVIANKDAWDKLDKSTQDLIRKEAALAERKGWQLSKMGNKNDKKALADAGMIVGKVNATLKKHFEEVGATMSKEWAEKAGSRGQKVLSAY